MGKKCGGYASYNTYEFHKGCKTFLKLPVNTYKNIDFLEKVFTKEHPCVAEVTSDYKLDKN